MGGSWGRLLIKYKLHCNIGAPEKASRCLIFKLLHLLLVDGVPVEQIGQIADFMYEWEGPVAERLGLTRAEVASIKERYPKDLNLQT